MSKAYFAIDIEELNEVIPKRNKNDMFSVELQYTAGKDVLHFEFANLEGSQINEKTIPIQPSEKIVMDIPEVKYDAVVKMPAGIFVHSIKNLQALGGAEIQIHVQIQGVDFSTNAEKCSATVKVKKSSSIDKVCCFLFQLLLFVRLSFFFVFFFGLFSRTTP